MRNAACYDAPASMDLLDRLLGHDAWTTRRLIALCASLSDGQLDREFDIGHQSVRATLVHIVVNMEVWSTMMAGEPVQQPTLLDSRPEVSALAARLDVAAARLANVARSVATRDAWDELWLDVLDDPPATKSYGGAIAHVITHSMHHRAQLLYMLRQLGHTDLPEGDVLSWESQRSARPST